MEPLPTDSLTQRLRAGRRARQNEKILQEKDIERKTEERQEAARTQSVPGEAFFAEVGGLFGFIGRFLSRVWRRPFEVKELINQMDEVGVKSLTLTGVVGFSIGMGFGGGLVPYAAVDKVYTWNKYIHGQCYQNPWDFFYAAIFGPIVQEAAEKHADESTAAPIA